MLKTKLMEQLPAVGDHRMEVMTVTDRVDLNLAEPCVVVEVNRDRLWYRVRFDRTGSCECYKLPRARGVEV